MKRCRSRARGQGGFTLVELMVAMPLALIVIFAAYSALAQAERSQHESRTRAEGLRQQQVGLERMTREIRHATVFQFLTSQIVEFDGFVHSSGTTTVRRVRYDCSSGSYCVRREGPAGGPVAATGVRLIEALVNPDVFDPEPNFLAPRYVGISASVRIADDKNLITLRDGVDLRNLTPRE
jgi:prepilin-type N-terminal cleavage/methylation domain-containing protein